MPDKNSSNKIRIRNAGEEDVDPSTLLINEDNFREHPEEQLALYRQFSSEVGFLGRVLVNLRNRKVLDGHMRVFDFKERGQLVPVQWVNLSAKEEKKALLMYDQVGEMALFNEWKLKKLAAQVETNDELTKKFLASLPNVDTIGKQVIEEMNYLFEDDDTEEDELELDFDAILGEAGAPSGSKKKAPVKIVLKGAQVAQFRKLIADAGKTGEVGDSSVVMVIMSEH